MKAENLPSDPEDLQNAITEIEAAAAQSGATEALTIQDDITAGASPIQVVEGKVGLDEVSFTLNTSSNFTQLLTFLKYLEHLPHFTEISKISIQSTISPTSSSVFAHSDTINTVIDGVFFVQKP